MGVSVTFSGGALDGLQRMIPVRAQVLFVKPASSGDFLKASASEAGNLRDGHQGCRYGAYQQHRKGTRWRREGNDLYTEMGEATGKS